MSGRARWRPSARNARPPAPDRTGGEQPKRAVPVGRRMNPPEDRSKPVEPTRQVPSTRASNPRQVRQERPRPGTQSVQTPDGGKGLPGAGRRTGS
jgi:hypothetical protein